MSSLSVLLVVLALVKASREAELKRNIVEGTRELKKSVPKPYQYEGCFNAGIKAGVYLGDFHSSQSPVEKCAQLSLNRGFSEFSLENGGHCRGGDDLQQSYFNSGTSRACGNGVGATGSAGVYSIKQTPNGCGIESSDKATKGCRRHRQKETEQTRLDYELRPPSPHYPLPSLNKSHKEVYMMLKRDVLDNHWIDLYNSTIFRNLGLYLAFQRITNNTEFEAEGDYTRTYNFFLKSQLYNVKPNDRQYFRFHFQDASIPFRNLSEVALWRDDGVFTDQRLAGSNPLAIQRVSWNPGAKHALILRTANAASCNKRQEARSSGENYVNLGVESGYDREAAGCYPRLTAFGVGFFTCLKASSYIERYGGVDWKELSAKLNPKFNWEGAIQDVLGMDISLNQAIKKGYVYAVHYPLYNGLPPIKADPLGTVMDAYSPIALFVSKPSRQQLPNRLKPVVIQLNSSTDSPVFTPEDSELWLKAKHVLQVADYAQTQVVEHLYKLHLFMEPVCVCMYRHLSKLHPLHQLLKNHCRGLIGANKLGYPFLFAPDVGSLDNLLTVGRIGAVKMILRAHQLMSWDDTDFLANIRNRGLDDKEKLPYFPYRDDGELIHETISSMINEYVEQYYQSHKEVQRDTELQNFARDVAVGSGKVKNFPTKITSRWNLQKHLTRIVWTLSAQHSVINYPANNLAALTSNTPTKLYDDDRVGVDHYGFYNLPRKTTCGRQAGLAMTLASMHYDSLFDYAQRLPDKKGRLVVQKYYNYLHGYVKSTIQQRNAQRFERGYLPYPFLVPGWIANSIHT